MIFCKSTNADFALNSHSFKEILMEKERGLFLGLYASEFNGVVIWDMKLLKLLSSIAQGLAKLRELIIAVATHISMLPSESDAR